MGKTRDEESPVFQMEGFDVKALRRRGMSMMPEFFMHRSIAPMVERLQSTLVITIRDKTISSLSRFDPMKSIMPVLSVNFVE